MSPQTAVGGWDAARAVQTLAVDAADKRWFGSGYLVAPDLVLTAAHVLHGASTAVVRFFAPGRVREVPCDAVFADVRADVAVLRLRQAEPPVAAVRFGYPASQVACEAVGFPWANSNDDHRAAGPDAGESGGRGRYRDSHHAVGSCYPYSNQYAGTLKLEVSPLGKDPGTGHSQWEGMSGAAVFAAGRLIAVVTEQHVRQGPNWLTASRAQLWYKLMDQAGIARLRELLGLPDTAEHLDAVGATASPAAVQMSLPRDATTFTGRTGDLDRLIAALDEAEAAAGGAVLGIHAVDGMAGVGKTAFAVHAAHTLAGRFPDGQWFIRLHGHTPGAAAADPDQVLAALLAADNVPADQIPPDGQSRGDLWRSRTAGRRMLLVLDDAAGSAQIRPLLPSAAGTLVLVTSRRKLTGLADAVPLSLDVLDPPEAGVLFTRIAGRPDLSPEDPLVVRLAGLCGHLPLAIGMAASQLLHHQSWSPEDLIEELAAAAGRLPVLAAEDVSVAAAFDLSYRDLNSGQQQLFRALGASPGIDVDPGAAAAILATDISAARRLLQGLEVHHLLDEPTRARYRMHDLLREHACALAEAEPHQSREAVDRLLTHYRLTAVGHRAEGREAELSWLRSERANLLACLDHAVGHGRDEDAAALTAALTPVLRNDGPWPLAVTLHAQAVAAAERLDDQAWLAGALNDLGFVQVLTGDFVAAAGAHEQALELFGQLDDRLGQAKALNNLGFVHFMTDDYVEAVQAQEQALDLFRQLGDRRGQAGALNELGRVQHVTGDYAAATRAQEQALDLFRQLGDRRGQAIVLNHLGSMQYVIRDFVAAARAHEQALELFGQLGDRLGQAEALNRLGRVQLMTGDYAAAARAHEQALEVHQQLGSLLGQANALNDLGRVQRMIGDYVAAARAHEQALKLYQQLGDRLGQAGALNELGRVKGRTGDHAAATQAQEQALELFRQIGDPLGQANATDALAESRRSEGVGSEAPS
ncbi:tetratricopeptide repeat protein [Catenulispora rubra]|uniref:tetratricopeptide repeat protein n=1 Tax=Catenulispora rubra TaxID=280293 RepID=UPI0018924A83|nr:tetratricopeptide repeat protein [Catenulispora rubra]